jgi:1-aminocyclopropane-1-carboxylate deaminase/D-cysteine desulfhydrase-like pyridoxal-dependent ACC family enzyme
MEMVPVTMLRARLAYRRAERFVIAPGGSDGVGTLGWVDAGLELAEQLERGELPRPAVVHVAAGTLGTAAGLALGLAAAGLDIPIAATRITSRIITNERALATLMRAAAGILQGAGVRVPLDRALRMVQLRHGQIGRGYGHETEAAAFALAAFAAAGLRLDGTYTAKAAAEALSPGQAGPVLFIHTLSAVEPIDRVNNAGDDLPASVATYLAQEGRG